VFYKLYEMRAVYVTTNYDENLDVPAKKPKAPLSGSVQMTGPRAPDTSESEVIEDPDKLCASTILRSGIVAHLHGSVCLPNKMVKSAADYFAHYAHENIRNLLDAAFGASKTVLFVGYSLEEQEVLEFILKDRRPGKSIRHFYLYPYLSRENHLLSFDVRYYESIGIKLVPYCISAKGHERLVDVIDEWSPQIQARVRSPGLVQKLDFVDRVLNEQ
jgi:hypothetical protein